MLLDVDLASVELVRDRVQAAIFAHDARLHQRPSPLERPEEWSTRRCDREKSVPIGQGRGSARRGLAL